MNQPLQSGHDYLRPGHAYEVAKLEELLTLLGVRKPSASEEGTAYPLLEQHARSARSYRLGAMRREYEVSLEQAVTAAKKIDDKKIRQKAMDLLKEVVHSHNRD